MNLIIKTISSSLFFYLYDDGKKRYGYDPKDPYGYKTMLIGLRASIICKIFNAPLFTIRTRLALFQEHKTIIQQYSKFKSFGIIR